jgi:hypothetical protein
VAGVAVMPFSGSSSAREATNTSMAVTTNASTAIVIPVDLTAFDPSLLQNNEAEVRRFRQQARNMRRLT